ncbi:MAG: hypothetical protein ACE5GJ_01065 [Gemmatimonadota bacterium]
MKFETRWTAAAVLLGLLGAAPLAAQERGPNRIVPTNAVVISGYGTTGYSYIPSDGAGTTPGAFQAGFNPIFLFQFQDRILFEAELEFELEEGVTATGLEYATLDIMATDNLILSTGKFLLPFGVFGERLHPTWINKMATMPPIYGHHGSALAAEPVLPILSDVGAMAKVALNSGPFQIGLNGYVTQGFQAEEHGGAEETHASAVAGNFPIYSNPAGGGEEGEIPGIGIPGSSEDITNNKMVGGRLDIALPPWAEVNFSAFTGKYDEHDELTMSAWNVAWEARHSGFELRGEYLQTTQQFEEHDGGIADLERSGFYTQLSYRGNGPWEPVVRFTRVNADEVENEVLNPAAWQTSVGLDYWISPSVAVMASYEFNQEDGPTLDNNRLNIHLAFGF